MDELTDDEREVMRCGAKVLLDAAGEAEPMRFLRHREVVAWQKRQRVDAIVDLVNQGRLYIQQTAMPWAQQFRGAPLVV